MSQAVFTNEYIAVKMSVEVDDVVKKNKTVRAAEIRWNFCLPLTVVEKGGQKTWLL